MRKLEVWHREELAVLADRANVDEEAGTTTYDHRDDSLHREDPPEFNSLGEASALLSTWCNAGPKTRYCQVLHGKNPDDDDDDPLFWIVNLAEDRGNGTEIEATSAECEYMEDAILDAFVRLIECARSKR